MLLVRVSLKVPFNVLTSCAYIRSQTQYTTVKELFSMNKFGKMCPGRMIYCPKRPMTIWSTYSAIYHTSSKLSRTEVNRTQVSFQNRTTTKS